MPLTHRPHGVSSFGFPQIGSGGFMSVQAANNEEIFFVSVAGADGNDGKSPDKAKLTVQAAVDLCTHDYGSYVFVGEGTFSEQVSITKRGIHLIGMGAYRTIIEQGSPSQVVAGEIGSDATIVVHPTHSGNKTVGVEVASMRIGISGGGHGIYFGDGAGTGNASASVLHDCIIDGSSLEGNGGVVIKGGSFIRIIDNIITGWSIAGVVISSGATRTAYANVVDHNYIIRNSGAGVFLSGMANCNLIQRNSILDSGTALTYCIGGATGLDIWTPCTGADNGAAGNWWMTSGTGCGLGANDHAAGNYLRSAGNAATEVEEE